MSFFVNGHTVAVADDQGNTVWVLGRMGVGTEVKVSADFARLGGRGVNAYQLALMRHNIVKWEGPDFDGVPCSHANINKLDFKLPEVRALFTAVLEKIDELNERKEEAVTAEEKAADPTPAAVDS